MITFKVIDNLAPAYLSDLVTMKRGSCYNVRLSKSITLFDPSAKYKVTLGEFKAAAPKTWNNLLDNIRNQSNINQFRILLKTHFFRLAYDGII